MLIIMNTEQNTPAQPFKENKIYDYKIVCAKLGFAMCIYFICRIFGGLLNFAIASAQTGIGVTLPVAISTIITVITVYIIPMLFTAALFGGMDYYNPRSERFRELYKKPKRLARAIGTFPAMYGLGLGIAALTFMVSYLITQATGGQTVVEDIIRPPTIEPATTIGSALIMVFMIVVIAPIFEEVLVRGIMYDALAPYGHGIAILITSILFGLMHGSMHMLLHTTVVGFALGYVRYATNSLLIVTILHAIINSVAAGMLLMLALSDITNGGNRMVNTVLSIYTLAVLVLIIVGIIAFFMKIPTIRKYKIENIWPELTPARKTALFFISIPVIIMLILAINEHTNYWLISYMWRT